MATRVRSKSASATKSRSETASRLLAKTPAKPRSAAVAAGSSGSDEPASAPAPSGDTSRRADRRQQPVDIAAERPPVGQEVVRQQHGLCPLQVGVARQVGAARSAGPLEQHLLEADDARRDDR